MIGEVAEFSINCHIASFVDVFKSVQWYHLCLPLLSVISFNSCSFLHKSERLNSTYCLRFLCNSAPSLFHYSTALVFAFINPLFPLSCHPDHSPFDQFNKIVNDHLRCHHQKPTGLCDFLSTMTSLYPLCDGRRDCCLPRSLDLLGVCVKRVEFL